MNTLKSVNKMDFRAKIIARHRGLLHTDKMSVQQDDIAILNVYVLNKIATEMWSKTERSSRQIHRKI